MAKKETETLPVNNILSPYILKQVSHRSFASFCLLPLNAEREKNDLVAET